MPLSTSGFSSQLFFGLSKPSLARTPIPPDIHTKAAALMHSLIRNHPFVDGNKRTAVLAVLIFYGLNGWEIVTDQGEIVALAVDVAEGLVDVAAISKTLKSWARQLELPDA
jgi:death-on-curing protein